MIDRTYLNEIFIRRSREHDIWHIPETSKKKSFHKKNKNCPLEWWELARITEEKKRAEESLDTP